MSSSFNKKLFSLFILGTVVASVIRWFFFENFGTFANDDVSYVGMTKNIFMGFPTVDGNRPHTLFPPGYSIILALENLVFESFFEAREFEYVILTGAIPFIILALFKPLNIKLSLPHISLLCFTPFFLNFTATLGGATEVWFTIFILCGIYLIINFHLSQKIIFLFLGNCLFSFSYLIRPEGLAYFISSLFAVLFFLNSFKFTHDRGDIIKILLSLLVPVLVIIIPYVLFLYSYTGQITISGKSSANQELVNTIFSTQNEQLISNIVGLSRTLVAPFLGPIILSLLLAFFAGVILRRLNFQKIYIFLIAPIPIIFLAMLKFLPWARALVSTVPIFIIFAVIGFDFLFRKFNSKRSLVLLFFILTITQLSITFTPLVLGKFDNNPKQYYALASSLDVPSKPLLLFSRDETLRLFMPNTEVCMQLVKCPRALDYVFLVIATTTSYLR